ncbi:type I restriction enzyme specificity protein [Burkholderia pseudomultivorans]|uniref:Type I restriction enzyme specificity protein n=1 Tax=Burkholderia pseudomultivorans TaxID=1207504 RepID=A0A6P2RSP8_9BURK|nr:restriction endonuclease subunit S [Burkholderia pseudomultivorans]VWC34606.1 type I restriction enzyme specificity protein [Burkholderia pseudomultivorans]
MSLAQYTTYKHSKVSWLGDVPSHWRVIALKRVVQTPITDGPHETPEFLDAGVPFVSAEAVSGGYINFQKIRGYISEEDNQRYSSKYRPQLHDIYLVKSGATTGTTAIVDSHTNFNIWSPLAVIRCARELANPFFVLNFLRSRNFQEAIALNWSFGTQQNIGMGVLGDLPVAVPPLSEQNTIATFLDCEINKIDTLIAEQEKLLELLAEKRQATISHAVTRGLNPDVPMKDSGVEWLGMVPKHWKVVPLKYLVTLRSGGTPSKDNLDYWDGDVPWASAKDLKVEKLADTADHITEYAVKTGAAALVPAGVILVVVRGMILARTFPVVETLTTMAINQDLKAIIPRKGLFAPFLAWLLRGSEDESLQRLDEAGHGTKALRMDAWTSMQLPIPPLDEQADIAKFVEQEITRLDGLKAEAARAIDLLTERRSALISAAVTGKIDVREYPSALAEAA